MERAAASGYGAALTMMKSSVPPNAPVTLPLLDPDKNWIELSQRASIVGTLAQS
jgi:hypothetical protein